MSRKRKRNKNRNKKHNLIQHNTVTQTNESESIGGIIIIEEKIIENSIIDLTQNNPAKPLDKITREKIEKMPQTYVEDTFDITHSNNHQAEIVIENPVIEKTKEYITEVELLKNERFKQKVDKTIKRILFKKSFNELLDLSYFSKINRTYFIDETTDEIDVLLYEVTRYFKKSLTRIDIPYKDYQTILSYFESIETIYRRFNHAEGAIKPQLKLELEKLLKMDSFIKYHLF